MSVCGGIISGFGVAERAKQTESSAIDDVEEDHAIAACRVLGLEDEEVSGEFDLPLAITRRQFDIGNDSVARVRRINGEVGFAAQFLVWADVAEWFAVQDIDPRLDLHADEFGLCRDGCREQQETEDGTDTQPSGSDTHVFLLCPR
jgi:hypothetical protein